VTGFSDDNNDTLIGNQSDHQSNSTMSKDPWLDYTTTWAVYRIIFYVVWALGIPGNILSAIVWLRRHVASENPSAIYIAALAMNDLLYLSFYWVHIYILYSCRLCGRLILYPLLYSIEILEHLLILSFSIVRLIAIRRPLQVCCMRFNMLPGNGYDRETARRSMPFQILIRRNKIHWQTIYSLLNASRYVPEFTDTLRLWPSDVTGLSLLSY